MKRKPLWKISIVTTIEAEDAVSELLAGIFNCASSSFFDAEKKESRVAVFISEKISRQARGKMCSGLNRIKNHGIDIGSGKIFITKIRGEDWAESWKKHFQPIEIGGSLLVKPSWSKKRSRKNQKIVVLDPGLSFGTGQHPTTEFCLREIARRQKFESPQSFLDIGAGSGILAIAAAKLGYKPVHAIDFDLEAIRVATANAKMNRVSDKLKIAHGDAGKLAAKPKKQFDLICANLISNLLITERRRIVAQLTRGGILVLAGILKSEFSQVQGVFEGLGLKLIRGKTEKEWRSGSFRRRKIL